MRLRSLLDNRSGTTTIYVSIFIMIIFILIILSFVQIVSRNHAETVKNQLNMQAVYAAETGIADARVRMLRLIDLANRGQIADFRSLEVPDEIKVGGLFTYTTNLSNLDVILIDGQRMIISDESANTTLVFDYNAVSGEWEFWSAESFKSDAMALDGDCLFVGDPSNNEVDIYMYDHTALTSPYFKSVTPSSITPDVISLNQGFGSALAINDGLIIVGSPEDDPGFTDAGSVYTPINITPLLV